MGGALSGEQIRELCEGPEPLLSGYRDLDAQVQPNGVDLTVETVSAFAGGGRIGRTNANRALPDLIPQVTDDGGWFTLGPGAYLVTFNEAVWLPLDVMALGRPRSSIARCGAAVHSAVWDAGYHGRSSSLLVVQNPAGFDLEPDSRILQLVFFRLDRTTGQGYAGSYQGERLGSG